MDFTGRKITIAVATVPSATGRRSPVRLNIPAVKVLLAAGGPEALHERLRLCGLTTLDQSGRSLRPRPDAGKLRRAPARDHERLRESRPARRIPALARSRRRSPTPSRRYSRPELVWQIADIMSDNSARTLAFGMNSALRFDYPVACKTGTSTDFRDNWTIGFTPEFTVGVWVGNFDGSPMREVSGVTGAGPILHAIFDHLHSTRGTSWYRTPPGIVERNDSSAYRQIAGRFRSARSSRKISRGSLCRRPNHRSTTITMAKSAWGRSTRNGFRAAKMDWRSSGARHRFAFAHHFAACPEASTWSIPIFLRAARIPLAVTGGRR